VRGHRRKLRKRFSGESADRARRRRRDTTAAVRVEEGIRANPLKGLGGDGLARVGPFSLEWAFAGGEARERGGEGERNAEHRAGANEGARCDPPARKCGRERLTNVSQHRHTGYGPAPVRLGRATPLKSSPHGAVLPLFKFNLTESLLSDIAKKTASFSGGFPWVSPPCARR